MKPVLAGIEIVIGVLMMGFLLPLFYPRYWQQAVIAFVLVAMGITLIADGLRRAARWVHDK